MFNGSTTNQAKLGSFSSIKSVSQKLTSADILGRKEWHFL